MKIFYHNDMDGMMSARIILNHMKMEGKNLSEKDFIEMDYTKAFPLELIGKDEEIYIVDYSISPDIMYDLLIQTCKVVWIDHHKTAIEKYKDFVTPIEGAKSNWKIPGIRADGIAGCVLTYWYFNGRQSETEEFIKDYPKNVNSRFRSEIPLYIRLAGDWDVWEHLYGKLTKEFTICFNTEIKSPFDEKLSYIEEQGENLDKFIIAGAQMIKYRNSWAETFMERYGFETQIEQYIAFVANLGNANSEFFGNIINKYDLVGTYCFNGESWTCSLYSTKDYVDCSEICVKYGGGGHKGAAGFVCKELPFNKRVDE